MIQRPPRSTRTDTHVPSTTLCLSIEGDGRVGHCEGPQHVRAHAGPAEHGTPTGDLGVARRLQADDRGALTDPAGPQKSEEHTSELQSLMRISYAVFCLTKKKTPQ